MCADGGRRRAGTHRRADRSGRRILIRVPDATPAGPQRAGDDLSAYLRRLQAPVRAVAHLDICNCELLNLLCGPAATQAFLAEVEAQLRAAAGGDAWAAHAWADEFQLGFPAADAAQAQTRIALVREALSGLRAPAAASGVPVFMSIGLVLAGADAASETLQQKAQLACREARRRGMHQLVVFDAQDPFFNQMERRLAVGSDLLRRLARRELSLHAQPIFYVAGGVPERIAKVEILLRSATGPAEDPLDPSTVHVAERYGFMRAVDEYVLREALAWMREHPEVFQRMERVSLNLSGRSLADHGFHEHLTATIRASGVEPQRLCFEITETSLVGELDELRPLLQDLRGLGCTIALDDFGVGLCSFGYLSELPVDEIKIDGSFIRRMTTDPVARSIVRALKEVADATGKRTVAEFVEDQAALDALQDLGVCYIQGWLFGRAMPLLELPAYLAGYHAPPLRGLPGH